MYRKEIEEVKGQLDKKKIDFLRIWYSNKVKDGEIDNYIKLAIEDFNESYAREKYGLENVLEYIHLLMISVEKWNSSFIN